MIPKTAVEKIHDKFKAFAVDVFAEVGEAAALVLVVDWIIGRTEFPAGFMIPRDRELDPSDLLSAAEQLGRMSMRLYTLYLEAMTRLKAMTADIEKTTVAKVPNT